MRRIHISVVLLSFLVVASPAFAQQPDQFFTFGDSLADNGNVFAATLQANPPVPPPGAYCQGRFSNGPVAFEFVWATLLGTPLDDACPIPAVPGGLKPVLVPGLSPAVNFGFGAATTEVSTPLAGGLTVPGLKGQVALFRQALGGQSPSPAALYAIVAGANDYLSLTSVPRGLEERTVERVVTNIADSIRELHRLGARHVIVLNLVDLGQAPLVAADPTRRALLSRLSAEHNRQLARMLAKLPTKLAGLNIIAIDLNQVVQILATSGFNMQIPGLDILLPPPPVLGGLPMSFCLFVDAATCAVVPDFNALPPSLFWDAEHPTTQAHFVLAQFILSRLQTN